MAPNVTGFSAMRARSYIFRLPIFTRAIVLIIALVWLVGVQSLWDEREWGALVPDKIGITTRTCYTGRQEAGATAMEEKKRPRESSGATGEPRRR